MILERISILNYKNIEHIELDFSAKINCFLGNNGMGKTNLLDAIYFLSFCKSHNNLVDSQNINHTSDIALIQGHYQLNDDSKDEFLCSLRRRQKKIFKRNKKEYEKLSDHIGTLPLVMISPSDSELISEGSEERRKFMDMVLSQFDKEYLHALIRYNKALQQRNALLKSEIPTDEALFELWDSQLSDQGQIIYQKRKEFIEQFVPTFQYYYKHICQSNEEVDLVYQSQLSAGDLMLLLKQKREKDKILGHTTVGIHRDDLEMVMDNYPIKKVGSQGQNKTYVISMKLAQFDFLRKAGLTTPILLLDDIFDKLDSARVEQIVKLVSGDNFGQIFITDTNRDHLDEILQKINNHYHLYVIENGEATAQN
ncbi:MAG: replication and repair protein RecF [Bacteroidota bacterium]|jgi:DNA replication and repair protein RecF